MRIVLAAEGTRGDVHPLIALGAALRAAGHDVILCSPPDFADPARAAGLEHRAVGVPVREYLTNRASALHGSALGVLREMERQGHTILAGQFAALPEAVRGADLVVGAGVQVAAPSAAELAGAAYRYVAYCPAILPSAEHPPAFLPLRRRSRRRNRLLWALVRFGLHATVRRSLAGYRRALGLPPVGDLLGHLIGERPVLAADRDLAPGPSDLDRPLEQIPCLLPFDEREPLPAKLEAFLANGSPPVYLGFGSMTDPDPRRTTAQLVAAVTAAGHRALLAEGWAGLGAGPLPEGVLAIGTVAHASLFPRCAAVVHHGGAGTTTTAARAGVPQILVPHVLDQFYWAERVTALGIGMAVAGRRRLAAGALAAAIEAIAHNEWVEERARELGARLRAGRARAADAAAALLGAERRDDARPAPRG